MNDAKKYNPSEIEKKWQDYWKENKTYQTKDTSDEKFYILDMFPYPSGQGLHVGHPKGYIATDIYARMKRMQGVDVLHPMGFDAFGLPAEQYAIKNKINPRVATEKNVTRYKEQLQMLGLDYDWEREVNTTDPHFYKWTQWMWKQMYKKGLSYESYDPVNWCPVDKTVLANEDLDGNSCERCGSLVEKKSLRQWTIRITDYADRLLEDLDTLDWEPHIKELQKNWIGKSEGAEIDFELLFTKNLKDNDNRGPEEAKAKFTVFTTRPDTLFGVTYLIIAPEHPWLTLALDENHDVLNNKEEVRKYIESIKIKTDIERTDHTKEKTGVRLDGVFAIHPITKEQIPIYTADYVLANYGTGVVMAVPAHDERDNEFAKKYSLPIKRIINPVYVREDVKDKTDFTKKNKIVSIVEDPDGNILTINWGPKLGGRLFLGGTIEDGEKPEETAVRELKEETGYTVIESVQVAEDIFDYKYFATSKNQAFDAETRFVHIKLASLDTVKTSLEEDEIGKFSIEWISKEKASKEVVEVLHVYAFNLFVLNKIYTGYGKLINSGEFNGLTSTEAKTKLVEAAGGRFKNQYKLRDWVFARQRYWGEPFPIVFDENGKHYAVADSELPVVLPPVEKYEPTDTGESPLATIQSWVEVYGYLNEDNEFVSCDKEDHRARLFKRETNTMPQWAGSSWYYLRYIDPHNDTTFVSKEKEKKWSPVDFYVGGAEHATRHLIYARFWHKFLYDQGLVSRNEPFTKLQTVGLIMAEDGRKMSKRWGNVINPDDVVREYGADTLRVYEMFMGPFDQSVAWSTKSMSGSRRFLDRVWKLQEKVSDTALLSADVEVLYNQTIKKVTEDIVEFKHNTAIASLMTLLNAFDKEETIPKDVYKKYLLLIAPFAPHMTEELWHDIGENNSIHLESWPTYNADKVAHTNVTVSVQVNGKLRGTIQVELDTTEEELTKQAQAEKNVARFLDGQTIKKTIVVKNKLVNFVV